MNSSESSSPWPARTLGALYRATRQREDGFAAAALVTVAFHGAALLLYGAGSILLARALGPQQWGYVVWFITGTTTIAMFADVFGFYTASAYRVASASSAFDLARATGTVLLYGLAVGVVAGAVFGWPGPLGQLVFPGFADRAWSALIALNVAGTAVFWQVRGLYWGRRNFLGLGALTLGRSGGFALLAVALVYSFGWQDAPGVAAAHVATTWLTVLGALAAFGRIARPEAAHLRACLGVGWRATGVNWLSFLHLRADQYLVNRLLGSHALGLYGVAVSLGEAITQVPGMLGMVIFPLAAGSSDAQRAARHTLRRTMALMVALGAVMVPLGMAAPALVRLLFGEAFLGAAPLVRAFLPAVVFLSALLLVNNHISGLGYPSFQIFATALALALNVAVNLALLPRVGVVGAAIASSVSYGVWLALAGGYLRRRAHARRGGNF